MGRACFSIQLIFKNMGRTLQQPGRFARFLCLCLTVLWNGKFYNAEGFIVAVAVAQTCTRQFTLSTSPSPTNGTYPAGTSVTFTFRVIGYTQVQNNWLHAVVPHFGNGWDISSITNQVSPITCDVVTGVPGYWSWYNQTVCGVIRNICDGAGFFFESNNGCAVCDPNNPGDNYGDNQIIPCTWTFTWTVTAQSCPPAQDGDDLGIVMHIYSDSETGSWNMFACESDPNPGFIASLKCCDCDDNNPCTNDYCD